MSIPLPAQDELGFCNIYLSALGGYGANMAGKITGYVLKPRSIAGDIDSDGDVDATDQSLFVEVLLGNDTNAAHVSASDMNQDGAANARDIQSFVNAIVH